MITLPCRGGILDGKTIATGNQVWEFKVELLGLPGLSKFQTYTSYTWPDGYGKYFSEWRLKGEPE